MNTATPTGLQSLRAACDQLVATGADDLLTDLHQLAVHHAARTGTEATLTELLGALGHHQQATAHATAVAAALATAADTHLTQREDDHQHDDAHGRPQPAPAPQQPQPAHSARLAGRPARIHQTLQNRRPAPQVA